jgi:hypothetical protein
MILVPLLLRLIVLSISVLMWTYAFQGPRGEVTARVIFIHEVTLVSPFRYIANGYNQTRRSPGRLKAPASV